MVETIQKTTQGVPDNLRIRVGAGWHSGNGYHFPEVTFCLVKQDWKLHEI